MVYSQNILIRIIGKCFSKHYEKCYGLEIPLGNFRGIRLAHQYNITVNPAAIIGENVTLFKGLTIGSVRSGKLKDCPVIGNHVVVGLNSTIVGNCKFGNDVLIAANTFVNFDVPDHSVVIGRPGVYIIKRMLQKIMNLEPSIISYKRY